MRYLPSLAAFAATTLFNQVLARGSRSTPASSPQINQNFSLVQVNFTPGVNTSKVSPLPRDILALSIEFCYIVDYLGDVGKPNNLSFNLLSAIQSIIGAPPVIRIGGHTQDNTTITNVFEPGNLEAVNVTFNGGLFKVLNENVPENQSFVFGLNFGQNNVEYPLAEVKGIEANVYASRIDAYELGNEPDSYAGRGKRTRPWNVQTYAQQQVDWLTQIKSEVTNPSHGFQLGAFASQPVDQGNFSIPEINALGVPEDVGNVKFESDHTYPFSQCTPEQAAEISLPALMNHINTIETFSQFSPSIASAASINTSFVLGETGSVSCHGAANISNTFGAALWNLDLMLHGATLGMRRVHFHNGSPFYYSVWQPVEVNGTAPRAWPAFSSLIYVAGALSGTVNPTIYELEALSSDTLALYAIYEGDYFYKILALNLEYYSAADAAAGKARPQVYLNVSSGLGDNVRAFALSGPNADTTDAGEVTTGGSTYVNGTPVSVSGLPVILYPANGIVPINASEALIIERNPNSTTT
ncbi:MAG: hypothetical protein M1820_004025 [Bogoriella megaspora]|nr:MAG: hypothetical protein M1820_004025 [Bogoriella megaspora]